MVRVKHRYLLFNIYYPTAPSAETFAVGSSTPSSASISSLSTQVPKPLWFSTPSSPQLTSQALASIFRESIGVNFGDWGSGIAGSLSIKYFSSRTSTGIVRIAREHFRTVWAALTFVREIQGREVVIAVSHVSGTIKKVEQHAVKLANRSIYRAAEAAGSAPKQRITIPSLDLDLDDADEGIDGKEGGE